MRIIARRERPHDVAECATVGSVTALLPIACVKEILNVHVMAG